MRPPKDRPMIASTLVLAAGGAVTLLAYAVQQAAEPAGGAVTDGTVLLVVGTVLALCLPLVVVHEAGHAVAARLVGARVVRVEIGRGGRQLFGVQVRGTELVARSRLLEGGRTVFRPDGLSRRRRGIVVVAGPLANLAVLGAALVALRASADWRVVAVACVCVAMLVADLVPSDPRAAPRNDARQLADLAAGIGPISGAAPAAPVRLDVSDRIAIDRPAEQVWAFVQPPESSVLTSDHVVHAFTVPGTPRGQVGEQQCHVVRGPDGTLTNQVLEVVELDPGRRCVTRMLEPAVAAATVTTVEPSADGCLLSVESRVGAYASHVSDVRANLAEYLRDYLVRVKSLVESDVAPPPG
jgi:hypothetical protein